MAVEVVARCFQATSLNEIYKSGPVTTGHVIDTAAFLFKQPNLAKQQRILLEWHFLQRVHRYYNE